MPNQFNFARLIYCSRERFRDFLTISKNLSFFILSLVLTTSLSQAYEIEHYSLGGSSSHISLDLTDKEGGMLAIRDQISSNQYEYGVTHEIETFAISAESELELAQSLVVSDYIDRFYHFSNARGDQLIGVGSRDEDEGGQDLTLFYLPFNLKNVKDNWVRLRVIPDPQGKDINDVKATVTDSGVILVFVQRRNTAPEFLVYDPLNDVSEPVINTLLPGQSVQLMSNVITDNSDNAYVTLIVDGQVNVYQYNSQTDWNFSQPFFSANNTNPASGAGTLYFDDRRWRQGDLFLVYGETVTDASNNQQTELVTFFRDPTNSTWNQASRLSVAGNPLILKLQEANDTLYLTLQSFNGTNSEPESLSFGSDNDWSSNPTDLVDLTTRVLDKHGVTTEFIPGIGFQRIIRDFGTVTVPISVTGGTPLIGSNTHLDGNQNVWQITKDTESVPDVDPAGNATTKKIDTYYAIILKTFSDRIELEDTLLTGGFVSNSWKPGFSGSGFLIIQSDQGSFEFEVTVPEDSTYQLRFGYALRNTTPIDLTLNIDGLDAGAVSLTQATDPALHRSYINKGFSVGLTKGTHTIRLTTQNSYSAIIDYVDVIELTKDVPISGNPLADADFDGLSNEYEANTGTNPNNADTDADGLNDGFEARYAGVINDQVLDTDGDGLTDYQESLLGTNPSLLDSDNDSIPDTCDLGSESGSDWDEDGVCDTFDNCPFLSNVGQQDANFDSVGDACQCGDLNSDGLITQTDVDAFTQRVDSTTGKLDTSDLTLQQIQKCDINGDTVCTAADAFYFSEEFNAANPELMAIRQSCASGKELHRKVLARIGYGPDNWTRHTLRVADVDPYQAVDAYIAQQLNPSAISDPEFDSKRSLYENAGALTAVDLDYISLKTSFCDPAQPYCSNPVDVAQRPVRIAGELKFLEAVYSNRQLNSVLRDFWFNHFNVFAGAGNDVQWLLPGYLDTIEDHMYGSFYNMLEAITLAPAMMVYLDLNGSPSGDFNQNFARELMELHTVGPLNPNGLVVYGSVAVSEVSRILTGYDYTDYYGGPVPANPLAINFDRNTPHDYAPKVFNLRSTEYGSENYYFAYTDGTQNTSCGGVEATGGENERQVLLCILARHPLSAKMIVSKLSTRFLGESQDYSEILQTVLQTWDENTELTDVVETILTDGPTGTDMGSYFLRSLYLEDENVKRPFEFSASLVRALGQGSEGESLYRNSTEEDFYGRSFTSIISDFNEHGDQMFHIGPPTGYKDKSIAWLGNSASIMKIDQVDRLVDWLYYQLSERNSIAYFGVEDLITNSVVNDELVVDALIEKLIPGGSISVKNKATIMNYLANQYGAADFLTTDPNERVNDMVKMILLTPEANHH